MCSHCYYHILRYDSSTGLLCQAINHSTLTATLSCPSFCRLRLSLDKRVGLCSRILVDSEVFNRLSKTVFCSRMAIKSKSSRDANVCNYGAWVGLLQSFRLGSRLQGNIAQQDRCRWRRWSSRLMHTHDQLTLRGRELNPLSCNHGLNYRQLLVWCKRFRYRKSLDRNLNRIHSSNSFRLGLDFLYKSLNPQI